MATIKVKNVEYTYEGGERKALSGISFELRQGEMVAIVGHNGSGKSTLAKLFNGLLLPTGGQVLVDGMDTAEEEKLLSIRQRVGMVFQNPDNQLVTTVVEEDVAFGPESLGVEQKEIRQRVDASLAAVNMQEYATRAPHMLSGGQKQRVAIAGMLAMEPEVLVLDEATAMLDPEGKEEVLSIIQKLNKERHMTVVIITQLMEETAICDRVLVLSQGELAMEGTPREVFRQGDALRAVGLDVPMMVRIREHLREDGMGLQGEPITTEELSGAITKELKGETA